MSSDQNAPVAKAKGPKRGAKPTPRHLLAAAMPYLGSGLKAAVFPPNFIRIPAQISMWGNYNDLDCVTAEEAFAKACNTPEIFIPDPAVIAWATAHNALNGAQLHDVLVSMQTDGFAQSGHVYDDGAILAINWQNTTLLNQAIWEGPVKLGVAANQLETTWNAAGGTQTGAPAWFATGYQTDTAEDHCVSLCGYGTLAWLAAQLNLQLPAGTDGNGAGYAMFTWGSIGVIDTPSLIAITSEAWLRNPTTITH